MFIAELEPGLRDDAVLALASDRRACLITQDTDFGELVFRQALTHHGVMLIRLHGMAADAKAALTADAVADVGTRLNASFTVITAAHVRVRGR